MTRYRLGLYEKALPNELSWKNKLGAAKRAGFDYMEISVDESDWRQSRLVDREEQAKIRNAVLDTGFPISTMCLSGHRKYPLGHPDGSVRQRSRDMLIEAVTFSELLGIRLIQLAGYDVYYETTEERTRELFLEELGRAAEIAAAHGVVLGFETMETPFMDTVEKAMVFVNLIASPYLQLYPDVGNLTNAALKYHDYVTSDLEKGRGHLAAVHLKETAPGIYRDLRFGAGHVDFDTLAHKCFGLGVRSFTGEFWHQKGTDYQKELNYAAAFLRNAIEKGWSHHE